MICDKLKEIREKTGMNKKEFANYLNIKYTTYNNYETGAREPASDFLILISKKFDISIDYIMGLTDEKNILHSYELLASEMAHIEKYRSVDDFGRETVDLVLLREVSRVENQKNEKRIKIPTGTLVDFHEIKDIDDTEPCKLRPVKTTLQSLSAGCGSIGDDDQYTEINYPDEKVPDGTDFASKITGDSMEPTFFDGDIVFYELTQNLREGDIGVFRKNDENFIKEYSKNGLVSHNPAYDIIIPGMDDHIETIGKVLGKL
ncbi:XRE family transcriptional regulator [Eubacterium maltosivorans]|uniref:Helix-turn-helix domain-containing protein n=1 Tax=Eubacterium maltosivorans TaxID=2041044 RepID=A0A4P9C7Y3_EUBML|nr:S24 family peptidase [Eubacterium maltosivorans]QCT71563.1 helix-turn-helix domain-containing protein [Eubacterium maltosivorans]